MSRLHLFTAGIFIRLLGFYQYKSYKSKLISITLTFKVRQFGLFCSHMLTACPSVSPVTPSRFNCSIVKNVQALISLKRKRQQRYQDAAFTSPPFGEEEGGSASADQRNEPDLRSESQSVCHQECWDTHGVTVSGKRARSLYPCRCVKEREALFFYSLFLY